MTDAERQALIRMLRDLRSALDVPPPKGADAGQIIVHLSFLIGKTKVVLDSSLVTLSS